jgi:predicted RNase H-like nuclease (RuvC/YqgF family)
MTKKRLSDLLREEVNPQNEELLAIPQVQSASPAETAPTMPDFQSELAIAQTMIDRLTEALSQEKAKVGQLQGELEAQKALIKTLTADLSQSKKEQKALDVVHQQKVKDLTEQVKTLLPLKVELESRQDLVNKLYEEIQRLETTLEKAQTTALASVLPSDTFALVVPARYVAPTQPSTHLSNDDIGWFD